MSAFRLSNFTEGIALL